MNGTFRSFLVLPSVLFLIWYLQLPFPLTLCGFIGALLLIEGRSRGGKVLLISSPVLVCWVYLAYFSTWQAAVAGFVIAYMLGLFIVGLVGYAKLTTSVWRFVRETRTQLRAVGSRAALSQPHGRPEDPTQKMPWTERLARRILGVS